MYGFIVPPLTVGSWAMITHSTPDTTPMPVTMLAPTVKPVPHAATGDSSRNGESGSSKQLDPLTGEQAAACPVPLGVPLAATGAGQGDLFLVRARAARCMPSRFVR